MRATVRNYIDAAKARREESGEKGFSLIELIVVVAILGILVAIAIPVFANIQGTAQTNALKTAAANGATAAAAIIADGGTPTDADLASLISGDITNVEVEVAAGLDDICIKATGFGTQTAFAGNGANAAGTACS